MDNKWWLSTGPMLRVSCYRNEYNIRDFINMLPKIAADGFKAIDLFAPYHGGDEYGGLDAIDFYSMRPGSGTFDDIREFICVAHELDIKVAAFLNLGYAAGGVTYMGLGQGGGLKRDMKEMLYEAALLTAIGQIINFNLRDWDKTGCAGLTEIFKLQSGNATLAPAGKRALIDVGADAPPSVFALRCFGIDDTPGYTNADTPIPSGTNNTARGKYIDAIFNFGADAYDYKNNGEKLVVAPLGCVFIDSGGMLLFK